MVKIRERKLTEFYMDRSHYAYLLVNIYTLLGGPKKKVEDLIGTLPEYLKKATEANKKAAVPQPISKVDQWKEGAKQRGFKTGSEVNQ